MAIRTLFLGIQVEKSDVDKELDPSKAPSLFDYDIVVCDVDAVLGEWKNKLPVEGPISSDYGQRRPMQILNAKLNREANLLLEKGGLLICFLKPVRGFSYEVKGDYGYESRYATNYGWIPISELSEHAHWRIAYGRGNRILLSDKPSAFAQYLRMTETFWVAYFDKIERLEIESSCLATSDAGVPVALEVPIKKGWLIFLPVSNHPKFGDIILQCATRFMSQKKIHGRPPPEWLKNFEVPMEESMNKSLQKLLNQISELQARLKEQKDEVYGNTEIKKLLYEGDEALENIVKTAFEEIGFVLDKKDDMDWISSSDTGEAILEVTGSESSIDIDKLRQLLNYLLSDYKATGTEKKAILVGNHFINNSPSERDDPFTEKVLGESKVHSICLLTTVELFKAICAIREKKLAVKNIQKKIMETVGICQFV